VRFDLLFAGSSVYVPGKIDAPSSSAALLRDDAKTVIVDPGGYPSLKELETALNRLGVSPDEVTDIILTHFHLDHAFNSIFFPNATVHLHKNYATRKYIAFGTIIGRMYDKVMKSWKRVSTFESGKLWDCIEIIETPYHSREHVSLLVETDNAGTVLFTGDICDRQFHYHEMRKGMRKDEAAKIMLELFEKADVVVFSHDFPLFKNRSDG